MSANKLSMMVDYLMITALKRLKPVTLKSKQEKLKTNQQLLI